MIIDEFREEVLSLLRSVHSYVNAITVEQVWSIYEMNQSFWWGHNSRVSDDVVEGLVMS